ncbi:hypothetical protein PTSG_08680 [Salpingoeca rosetta]|uniref:UBX domain-containing protein n=1 Tax=Salpingoeca rosetta (strain ATCC 50818 / BSB-021) TaxID=946362 RepID=F2UKD4_SALR5|nr:uncharacterized protein PTSG_08680 [Salpingoeca rosetta]EGD77583.1 hypothetical protein PTSG_08680 [Salpingoeca rosetta]|eukprot:XP_004990471.1 hypothetical protein PTSG_08680 [Salpingoeca rosetta]
MVDDEKRVFTQVSADDGIAYHLLPSSRYNPDEKHEPVDYQNFKFPASEGEEAATTVKRHVKKAKAEQAQEEGVPACDRQPVLFFAESAAHAPTSAPLPEQFFDVSRNEVMAMIPDKPIGEQPLTSAVARRKKEEAKRVPPPNAVVVRLTFSDRTVIQARFLPEERVASAYALLDQYVRAERRDEVLLFTAPPRRPYPRSSRHRFADVSPGSCIVIRIGSSKSAPFAGRDVLTQETLARVQSQASVTQAVEQQVAGVRQSKPKQNEKEEDTAKDSSKHESKRAGKPRLTPEQRQARLEAIMLKHMRK